MSDKLKGGYKIMEEYCCYGNCSMKGRSFLTREEKIEMLKEYKEYLEKETSGIKERITELEKGK